MMGCDRQASWRWWMLGFVMAGCGGDLGPQERPQPPLPEESASSGQDFDAPDIVVPDVARLDNTQLLSRISLALRGRRPEVAAIRDIQAHPEKLESYVDAYLASDDFGEVIKDMHAEMLKVRADVLEPLPAKGPLSDRKLGEVFHAHSEAPLELVRHIVMNDRPYSEIVTADYMVTNREHSLMYGLDFDLSGPEWQVSHWSDHRPHAGLLSSSELWRLHESAGSNFHRLRANFVADTLLCSDFANRDIQVAGEVTISDEFEVANLARTDPGCISCHQALDPLASFFWGFPKRFKGAFTARAYASGCGYDWGPNPPTDEFPPWQFCYPIRMWAAEAQRDWAAWDLRPPGYYGQAGDDLADLGALIAGDPRFSQCMARQFYGYLTQRDKMDVPLDVAVRLQEVFEASGFDAKALVKAVVMDDSFRTHRALVEQPSEHVVALQTIRPEQYARTIEALTGFRWVVTADLLGCDRDDGHGTRCWGDVDLMRSDFFGYRAMFGGITGYFITLPTTTPTPTKELVAQRFAFEAAGYVVDEDLSQDDPSLRRLLTRVDRTSDDAAVRSQLVALHERVLGMFVASDGPEVEALFAMYADKVARDGSVDEAWKLVLAALFLDPAMMFY